MSLRIRLTILLTGLTAACGKNTDATMQSDGSNGPSETSLSTVSSSTTHDASTSSPTTSGTSTGVVVDTTSSVSSDSSASVTAPVEDFADVECDPATKDFCCNPWTQDCPPGEKCNWLDPEGAGHSWMATKCFPIMEDPAPVGADCFVIDNASSGQDNCEHGAMCWDVIDGMGRCVALCTGSSDGPECPRNNFCRVYSGLLSLCFEFCDPLVQDCAPGGLCLPDDLSNFICMHDKSGDEGKVNDPCDYLLNCDPGNICVFSSAAVECDPEVVGCCQPFCDSTLPNTCPGQGQECVPFHENVGFCSLPG